MFVCSSVTAAGHLALIVQDVDSVPFILTHYGVQVAFHELHLVQSLSETDIGSLHILAESTLRLLKCAACER